MEEKTARELVVNTGLELLNKGLVARTWGNVSCRLDYDNMAISPSGLDYMSTTVDDIVKVKMSTVEWEGDRKPSSERGIHIAAYKCFPTDNIVVHTHQDCASAVSLAGFDELIVTEDEEKLLGGLALAEYGLPGTDKLRDAVKKCFEKGAHTVFMEKHGVVISAKSKEQVMERIALLEDICRRNLKCSGTFAKLLDEKEVMQAVNKQYPNAECLVTPYLLTVGKNDRCIIAQLDDMAQMIGRKVKVVKDTDSAIKTLNKCNAVIVTGLGAIVNAAEKDDVEALKLLVNKAAMAWLHTKGCEVHSRVGFFDAILMRSVYVNKYSKRKAGKQ